MLPRILKNISSRKTVVTALFAIVFLLLNLFIFKVGMVNAQDNLNINEDDIFGTQIVGEAVNLPDTDIRVIAAKIIRAALGLLGIVAFVIILYGGFVIMTSGGSEDKIGRGKQIITNGVIGIIIIMSSLAITQFIIGRLSDAIMGGGSGNTTIDQGPTVDFTASGSLGSGILRDHYPFPDQEGVARNTSISVNFRLPIDPSTLIENTNNTCWSSDNANIVSCADGLDEYYGDCAEIDGETICDMALISGIKFYKADNVEGLLEMTASVAMYEGDDMREAFTFLFDPILDLGDDFENVKYEVDLTEDIMTKDGRSAFVNSRSNHYAWNFWTSTEFDFDPPNVVSVYPNSDSEAAAKNSVIKITFSEPIDPTVVQGLSLPESSFTNIIFGSETDVLPEGEWRLAPGFRTVEFVSYEECGENSCGDTMYCLPISGCGEDTSCTNDYTILVRTAELQNPDNNNFQSQPFTGIRDMSGNALDNGPDNRPDRFLADPHKPEMPDNRRTIGENEKTPDNYFWTFSIQNSIDRSSPYIKQVMPGLDKGNVAKDEPVRIHFSKGMWETTFSDGVSIEEYSSIEVSDDDLAYWMNSVSTEEGDVLFINHRTFGPNNKDFYYFTSVSSTVKGVNQNCLYPGRGPAVQDSNSVFSNECSYILNEDGSVDTNIDCASVNVDYNTDTACIQFENTNKIQQPDIDTCVNYLKDISQ
jgi:hypothetical protein